MRKIIILLTMVTISPYVFGGIMSAENQREVIYAALENFWGKARRLDGSAIFPESDEDKNTLPIAEVDARLVVEVGEISGIAEWCGLEWKPNYFMLTRSARESGLNDKQVAYIGVLHGFTMGIMGQSLAKTECQKSVRDKAEARIKSTTNKSINFAPSVPRTR